MKDTRIGTSVVNHPSHYNQGKIEVIEFIEDQNMGFHLGNALKYISRAGKKNPEKLQEDLDKAKWYITRFVEIHKANPRRPNDMAVQVELPLEGEDLADKTLSGVADFVLESENYHLLIKSIVHKSITHRLQEFEDCLNEAVTNHPRIDPINTMLLDMLVMDQNA